MSETIEEERLPLGAHDCAREWIRIQCRSCGHVVQVLSGTRERTCPECAKELYKEKFDKYLKIIIPAVSENNLRFVTLTWRPVTAQSAEQIDEMFSRVDQLFHRKWYKRHWKAAIGAVECKKTPLGLYYYHLHLLVNGSYRPQALLSKDWDEVSGHYIVYIESVRGSANYVLHYILKYVLKGYNFRDERDKYYFRETMHRKRLIRTYGEWYNVQYNQGLHVPYPCPKCGGRDGLAFFEYVDGCPKYEIEYQEDAPG